jgi:hypothetical protein
MTKTTGLAGNEGKTMDFNELAAHLTAEAPPGAEYCPYAVLNSVAREVAAGFYCSAAVRLMALAGLRGLRYSPRPELSPVDVPKDWSEGRRRLLLVTHATRLAELLERPHVAALAYSKLLDYVVAVAASVGLDVLDDLRVRYDA